MRETTVLFGSPKTLVGVVTDPERSNGFALLLLNAGYTHHVGPQRLYVRMARRLAAAGFTALRFDHSGIGDSPRRSDSLPFPDSAIKDVRDAMDFLHKTRGIDRFLVSGICWGADNAIRIASVDSRTAGVFAVDFYAVPSIRHYLRVYLPRALLARSWRNVLTGRSRLISHVWALAVAMARSTFQRKDDRDDVLPSLPPAAVLASLRELASSGVDLCFVYASSAVSYDQYVRGFRAGFRELEQSGRMKVKVFDGTDHLFTVRARQTELLALLAEWAEGVAAAHRPAAEVTA